MTELLWYKSLCYHLTQLSIYDRVWALKPPLCCLRGPDPFANMQARRSTSHVYHTSSQIGNFLLLSLAELYVIRKVKAMPEILFPLHSFSPSSSSPPPVPSLLPPPSLYNLGDKQKGD